MPRQSVYCIVFTVENLALFSTWHIDADEAVAVNSSEFQTETYIKQAKTGKKKRVGELISQLQNVNGATRKIVVAEVDIDSLFLLTIALLTIFEPFFVVLT